MTFFAENNTDLMELELQTINDDDLQGIVSNVTEENNTKTLEKSPNENIPGADDSDDDDRFETLNDEEIDAIASATTAKATEKQTKWAVRIFRGKKSPFF